MLSLDGRYSMQRRTAHLVNPVANNLYKGVSDGQTFQLRNNGMGNEHYNGFPGPQDRTAEAEHGHKAKVPL